MKLGLSLCRVIQMIPLGMLFPALGYGLEDAVRRYPASDRFGMNLTGVTWYVSNIPFWDVMKTARPWRGLEADSSQYAIETDGRGYPVLEEGQTAATWVLNDVYPEGLYTFTYEGSFSYSIEAEGLQIVTETPGEVILQGDPTGYMKLSIWDLDPEDPPRDFHLWLPGYGERTGPFTPLFLEHLKPFGTFRYMTWQETNNNPVVSWIDRKQREDFTWMDGVPVEVLVDLANRMQSVPWFCIPEAANDDFILHFAETVSGLLDPDLECVVEYSNEVFNGSSSVFHYAEQEGARLELTSAEERDGLDSSAIRELHRHRYHGLRTAQISGIWKAVFGESADRVEVVLTGDAGVLGIALPFPAGEDRVVADVIDQVAENSYWGYQLARRLPPPYDGLDTNDVFDYLENELLTDIRDDGRAVKALADRYGLPLYVYEGGQHLSAYGGRYDELSDVDRERLLEVSLLCQRDPRMGDLMQLDWDIWLKDIGVEGYCIFSHISQPSGEFAWGLWEYQGQALNEAVKASAFIEYLQTFRNSLRPGVPVLEILGDSVLRINYVSPPLADPSVGIPQWSNDLKGWSAANIELQDRPSVDGGRVVMGWVDLEVVQMLHPPLFFRIAFPRDSVETR